MKKVLIINGHPHLESFCNAVTSAYEVSAKIHFQTEVIHLTKLTFDPILRKGYAASQVLESDLERAQELIKGVDHLVWVYPNWWGSIPALLKGFIDRVFTPGFAFQYGKSPFPDQLLKGKTSELIVTMDTPPWYYRLFMGSRGVKIMEKDVLGFCGVKNIQITLLGPLRNSSKERRALYLEKVSQLPKKLKWGK